MSKKNKVSSAKVKGSSKTKKQVKTVAKSKTVKKAPIKKQKMEKKKPAKKVVSKAKVAPKKSTAKPVKKVAAKKLPAKKLVKKVVAKKVTKPAPKKAAVKKAPVKKVVAKKVSAKKVVVKKPAPKKSPIKKTTTKALKPIKKATSKPVKAPVLKKAPVEKVKAIPEPKISKAAAKKMQREEEKKDEVLAIINTIPKEEIPELSASKIASITSSITNPIKTAGVYAVKVDKEPSGKYEIEFPFRASSEMIYEFFSTASGLSEWFCDDVNIRNGIYTFIWDGQMQQARLLKTVDNSLARFQWVDKTDGSYFEFRIQRDDLTNDISLIVTDFAESKSETESAKLLWQSQIEKLMHVIGSIY